MDPGLRRNASRCTVSQTRDEHGRARHNIMNVDYSTKIPNNVNLSEDRQVLKAWKAGIPAI